MSTATRPYPQDLRLLTALRAFAALLVVLFHFSARTAPGSVLHTTLIDNGQLGVDIFFVLSGFILAHVYLARVQSLRFGYTDFLVNRFARLYPMHLVMLGAAILNGLLALRHGLPLDVYGPPLGLDPASGKGFSWNLIANLALVHAWGVTNAHYFNAVSWSISAEAFAYLFFPVTAWIAIAFGNKAWLRLCAAVAFYLFCEGACRAFLGVSLNGLSWHFGILRILPEFILGVAFYRLGAASPMPLGTLRWLAPAVVVGVPLLMAAGGPAWTLPPLFGLVILLLADCERQALVPPPSLLRPAVYLGEISYSTYMIHLLLGKVYFNALARVFHLDPHALPAVQVVLALVPVLFCSAITYHLIELPGRRMLRGAWLRPVAGPGRLVSAP